MRNYSTNAELDELGDGIARGYLKSAGAKSPVRCIDIVGLANSLGLQVVYKSFAEDDPNKIGFLSDGSTRLMIHENGKLVSFLFPLGTIVLDTMLHRDAESGRCRFTIAHEIAHHVLDRHSPAPQFHRVFDPEQEYSPEELRKQFNMTETQADRLAAAILMPRFIVDQALKDFNKGRKVPVYGENVIGPKEKTLIQRMADQAGVSYTAMKIRLRQFQLFDYRPLSEYVEGSILGGGS